MEKPESNIWLVRFPLHQYNEDVKKLAVQNGLKIICASQSDKIAPEFLAKNIPELTLKNSKERERKKTIKKEA